MRATQFRTMQFRPGQLKSGMRVCGALVCALQLAIAAQNPAAHVRNFEKVDAHVYRGGEPTAVGLTELTITAFAQCSVYSTFSVPVRASNSSDEYQPCAKT